jgi:hypothetical protein
MKSIIAVIFLFSILTFGCDRCPQVEKYFDIEGIRSVYVINNDPAHTSDYIPSDSISFQNFALRTDYSVRFYSNNRQNYFSFVPAAYALSCVEPGEGGTKEKIASLDLISLSDYNKSFKAGTSLAPIVNANGLPVLQFISNQNQYGLNQWGFDLNLTEKPDSSKKQVFKIILKLQDGETFEAQTQPIIIY